MGQTFLGLDPFEQTRAQAAQFFGDGQDAVAALFEPGVVFVRERSFLVMLGRARREFVSQFRRQINKALLTLGMSLFHCPSPAAPASRNPGSALVYEMHLTARPSATADEIEGLPMRQYWESAGQADSAR